MATEEYLKWIMPSISNRTVPSKYISEEFNFRIEKAREQLKLPIVDKKDIVGYVNEFLKIMEMETVDETDEYPYVKPKKTMSRRIDYSRINTENKQDIVWIKFITDEHISVIGTGCDIFFTDNAKNNTTSGRINKALGVEWDETEVLIFPLKKIGNGLNRSDIESGIGNYLIAKGVPILDFYSHNY